MLFLFHVDTGTMITLDMSLALETVQKLKEHVEEVYKIPLDKQVLLASGGECLDPAKTVCSYPSGTDTSPIFLFSKSIIQSSSLPSSSVNYDLDAELKRKYKECIDLPATLSTVTRRSQLAQQYQERAEEISKFCEDMISEQYMQQQGWFAVVANLSDILGEFKNRTILFIQNFNDFLEMRDYFFTFLNSFKDDLIILQKIPILPILLESETRNFGNSKTEDNAASQLADDDEKDTTMLEWISAADSMDQLFEHCSRGLEQFDIRLLKALISEIDALFKEADRPEMKEVKGLSDRLFGLQELRNEVKKFVEQQVDLAQSFLKNESRASNLQDQSILPDLCASHKKQLQLIAQNHDQLCEKRRRCVRAKNELSGALHLCLKWVMFIEDRVIEIDQKLVICYENMKRIRRHLEVLQQIHVAPTLYLTAVAEVVRRRIYSQAFLLWASEVACHMLTIYNEEVTRRKDFQSLFEGHFLTSLIPGTEDLPPSFATQAPSMFDTNLPKLTMEHVEKLRKALPDMAEHLNMPDISATINFFLTRYVNKKEEKVEETEAVEDKLVEGVNKVGLASNLDNNLLKGTGSEPATVHGLPHLKDLDRGCESETDTEEFEKVGQSPLDLNFDKQLPSTRAGTQDASTLTEDNLQISKSEHEKVKSLLVQMQQLARDATVRLRTELNELRTQVLSDKIVVSQHYESLGSSWENLMVEREVREKDLVESIRKDHEVTVTDLKKVEGEKNEKIQNLLMEKSQLEAEILKSCENLNELKETLRRTRKVNEKQIEDLQKQLQEKEMEKERNLKELADRLNREHTVEVQNIRSRFKFMTMERSPSDLTAEWTSQHSGVYNSTLFAQMTENFEIDKAKAIASAVAEENQKWEQVMTQKIKDLEHKFDLEKENFKIKLEDVLKTITEEKDKQIELLTQREANLSMECSKYKTVIQNLTDYNADNRDSELLDRINILQKEKEALEIELERIKSENVADLSASVAVVEGKDATTSPIKQKPIMSKSEVTLPKVVKVSVDSCKAGDLVIVLWDSSHESFKILQENKHMYFLHSDCLASLGLEVIDGKPNKSHCTGEVIDKEYCHARKSENRYRVPKGTKFFRVKVGPVSSETTKEVARSYYQQRSSSADASVMSHSHSTISTITEVIPEDKCESQSLPPSPTFEYPTIIEEKKEDINPVEKCFAQDSGIVDNIDQATAALDVTLTPANQNEGSDRTHFSNNLPLVLIILAIVVMLASYVNCANNINEATNNVQYKEYSLAETRMIFNNADYSASNYF